MTEIQGKSILVRVSARFELARAQVIGSQLYLAASFKKQELILLSLKSYQAYFRIMENKGPKMILASLPRYSRINMLHSLSITYQKVWTYQLFQLQSPDTN